MTDFTNQHQCLKCLSSTNHSNKNNKTLHTELMGVLDDNTGGQNAKNDCTQLTQHVTPLHNRVTRLRYVIGRR